MPSTTNNPSVVDGVSSTSAGPSVVDGVSSISANPLVVDALGVPSNISTVALEQCGQTIHLRLDLLVPELALQRFDPLYPPSQAQVVASGGRAAAWFVQLAPLEAVLRHFKRGGWMARLARDRYLWLGLARTRSFAEFDLLRLMWQAGLPVPRPLGAAVWRGRLTYRAALLTERIPQAKPLALCSEPQVWLEAGRVVAQMHQFEVWHADLNVFNLLVDAQDKVWIIDLDRGRRKALTATQRAENLSRLLRSVRKVAPELEAPCWHLFKQGYQEVLSQQ
ncbi:MAG: 3-deoxy-D-manno-octulosonic acid kinase [Zwartia sp.]